MTMVPSLSGGASACGVKLGARHEKASDSSPSLHDPPGTFSKRGSSAILFVGSPSATVCK